MRIQKRGRLCFLPVSLFSDLGVLGISPNPWGLQKGDLRGAVPLLIDPKQSIFDLSDTNAVKRISL
jgi:hypothetical protein